MSTEDPTQSSLVSSAEAVLILSRGRAKAYDRAAVIRWARQGRIKIVHKIPGHNGAFLFDRESVEKFATQLASDELAS